MGKRIIQNEKIIKLITILYGYGSLIFFVSSRTELPTVGNLICRRPQEFDIKLLHVCVLQIISINPCKFFP